MLEMPDAIVDVTLWPMLSGARRRSVSTDSGDVDELGREFEHRGDCVMVGQVSGKMLR
jgi:hypothetical protein